MPVYTVTPSVMKIQLLKGKCPFMLLNSVTKQSDRLSQ